MAITPEALQARWMAHDARLNDVLRLNRRVLLAIEQGHTRSALQRFRLALWAQIGFDAVAAVALGVFISQHFAEPRFLVPAVALHVFVIAAMIAAARQLVMLSRIDHDGPVTTMQQRIETLRAFRIRATIVLSLAAAALWVATCIVLLKGVFGVDVYRWFPMWFFVLNVGVSAMLSPLALWISRRHADRLGAHPAAQWAARELAGASLNAARDQLGKLAAFERDDA